MKYVLVMLSFFMLFAGVAHCQNVFSIFRFKHNAEVRRQRLFDSIQHRIDSTAIKPFKANIKALMDSLSEQQNNNFDSLQTKIVQISNRIQQVADSVAKTGAHNRTTDNTAASDSDINALAAMMAPIITTKVDELSAQEQDKALSEIMDVMNNPGKTTFKKINDTLTRVFKYSIKKQAPLMAFHYYGDGGFKGNYLKILDGIYYAAFKVEGSTGNIKDTPRWKDDPGYVEAKASKLVMFSIEDEGAGSLYHLVKNPAAMANFIRQAINLVEENQVGGINLWFVDLNTENIGLFTTMADTLFKALKRANAAYQLNVRIPSYMTNNLFNLAALSHNCDKLLVDFTTTSPKSKTALPTAPLNGNGSNNIKSCMSWYLNQGVAADKFILCFSYEGTWWRGKYKNKDSAFTFLRTQPYNKIKGLNHDPLYNDEYEAAFFDTLQPSNKSIVRIWYDDEKTLAPKYDYVIDKNLGGLALWKLGDDNGYGSLADILEYKFLSVKVDSVDSISTIEKVGFLKKMIYRIKLDTYILNNPCDAGFNNDTDIYAESIKADRTYDQCKKDLRFFFTVMFIAFTVLWLAMVCLYFYKIRLDDGWPYRKKVLRSLNIALVFALIFLFSLLFVNKHFLYFGIAATADLHSGYIGCSNISYFTLLSIILVAAAVSIAVTIFFIVPLLKREDVP